MKSKVVLVIGALTGIGRAAAFAFAGKGAQINVSGRRDEAGEALANQLRSLGSEAEYIPPRADQKKSNGKVRSDRVHSERKLPWNIFRS
jgi:NAD(P)-dependent dehydrogenase (short-subunit alcohol dehydrogenase family)